MSPEAAYLIERPHLVPLPDALPPVCELLERVVDLHGYVSVDTNRYSVPERYVGRSVAVYKLPAEIHVCRKGLTIAVHRRLIGERDARNTLPGHHTIPVRQGPSAAQTAAVMPLIGGIVATASLKARRRSASSESPAGRQVS
jgi:hypothetical protein